MTHLHLRRRLLALAGLAGIALLPTAPAGAVIPTTSGIHHWAFHTGAVDNEAEAVAVARAADIVIGHSSFLAHQAAMRQVRPGILIAQYHSGVGASGAELTRIRQEHPDWLARDAAGNELTNEFGKTLLNPALLGVREHQASWARQKAAEGWDAVYLDALGLFGLTGYGATPIDPRTGEEFTFTSWTLAAAGLAEYVTDASAIPVIANGLRDGETFYGFDRDSNTQYVGSTVLAGKVDGGVFEGCFRRAPEPLSKWPTVFRWKQQVRAIEETQTKGAWALCMTKTWGEGTDAERAQWHDFSLASFLLGAGSRAYHTFWPSRDSASVDTASNAGVPIGRPLTARFQQGSAWLRRYAAGIVAVNPSGTATAVSLGGSYRLPNGTTGSSMTLQPHTGVILRSAA